jgi:hypothetical protein
MKYAHYINKQKGMKGHLWQGRFYSCVKEKHPVKIDEIRLRKKVSVPFSRKKVSVLFFFLKYPADCGIVKL